MALGRINVGMTSTLKHDSDNALELHKTDEAKAKQEMDKAAKEAADKKDQILYQAIGNEVFNCFSEKSGKRIAFKSGRFIAEASDTDIVDTLAYFVKQGRLKIVELETPATPVPETPAE